MKQTLLTLCLIVFALPSLGQTTFSGGNISGGKIGNNSSSSNQQNNLVYSDLEKGVMYQLSSEYFIKQEPKKKANQERKKAIKEPMQKDQSIPSRNRAKGKRQTDHMIEQTIYMPLALRAILEQEFNTGGWGSMSEIVRCGIFNYFHWLENNADFS